MADGARGIGTQQGIRQRRRQQVKGAVPVVSWLRPPAIGGIEVLWWQLGHGPHLQAASRPAQQAASACLLVVFKWKYGVAHAAWVWCRPICYVRAGICAAPPPSYGNVQMAGAQPAAHIRQALVARGAAVGRHWKVGVPGLVSCRWTRVAARRRGRREAARVGQVAGREVAGEEGLGSQWGRGPGLGQQQGRERLGSTCMRQPSSMTAAEGRFRGLCTSAAAMTCPADNKKALPCKAGCRQLCPAIALKQSAQSVPSAPGAAGGCQGGTGGAVHLQHGAEGHA